LISSESVALSRKLKLANKKAVSAEGPPVSVMNSGSKEVVSVESHKVTMTNYGSEEVGSVLTGIVAVQFLKGFLTCKNVTPSILANGLKDKEFCELITFFKNRVVPTHYPDLNNSNYNQKLLVEFKHRALLALNSDEDLECDLEHRFRVLFSEEENKCQKDDEDHVGETNTVAQWCSLIQQYSEATEINICRVAMILQLCPFADNDTFVRTVREHPVAELYKAICSLCEQNIIEKEK